jgi:hypothetical protein
MIRKQDRELTRRAFLARAAALPALVSQSARGEGQTTKRTRLIPLGTGGGRDRASGNLIWLASTAGGPSNRRDFTRYG